MTAVEVNSRQVRRNFGAHAEDYDCYAQVQRRVVERLLEICPTPLPGDGRILDVGTGTGLLARQIQDRAAGRPLVLSDLAHGMTRHARSCLNGDMAVDADAAAFPFASGSFGLVTSSSVYQWVESLDAGFAEVARILTFGGWFALALFGEKSLYELKHSHRQALLDCGMPRRSHVQEFPASRQVGQALRQAGFVIEQIYEEEEVDLHADVPTLLRSLKKIGASNASKHRPPGLAPRRVMERMFTVYGQEFATHEGVPATYEVIYVLARKPGR